MLRYPYFHPERPRFFNMATFFTQLFYVLDDGVETYLKHAWNLTNVTHIDDKTYNQIAYESFVRWEESGGKELQLAANHLTNRQLYWVATARFISTKFHPKVPKSFNRANRLKNKYLHVDFKNNKGFQEAFKCEMTAEEKESYAEFIKENLEVQRKK